MTFIKSEITNHLKMHLLLISTIIVKTIFAENLSDILLEQQRREEEYQLKRDTLHKQCISTSVEDEIESSFGKEVEYMHNPQLSVYYAILNLKVDDDIHDDESMATKYLERHNGFGHKYYMSFMDHMTADGYTYVPDLQGLDTFCKWQNRHAKQSKQAFPNSDYHNDDFAFLRLLAKGDELTDKLMFRKQPVLEEEIRELDFGRSNAMKILMTSFLRMDNEIFKEKHQEDYAYHIATHTNFDSLMMNPFEYCSDDRILFGKIYQIPIGGAYSTKLPTEDTSF